MDSSNYPETLQPCSSGTSRKRKQPDEEDFLLREGPLAALPIDNEYEQLDDEDEGDDDQSNKLRRVELERIKLAQEKATINQYDDIKVTPFNLDEELEEGQLDEAGNFIFKETEKESDEDANDTWAESVDWDEVTRKEHDSTVRPSNQINDIPTMTHQTDRLGCLKEMLRLMKPDETIKRAIQRLGQSVPRRRPFNKNAKSRCTSELTSSEEDRRKLERMIELAHLRLEDGDMDIYQRSYEDLEEAIQQQ